jgi:pimeloyl-ACP methyl ester carboxylesterase
MTFLDLAARIPRATSLVVVVVAVTTTTSYAHFPWIEQPEEFRRALAAFLTPASPTRN